MRISKNKFIIFTYRLSLDQEEDQKQDSGPDDTQPEPQEAAYIHGYGQIIPGLEAALQDKQPGEKFRTVVAPDQGYGERNEELVVDFPRQNFSSVENLEIGMELEARSDEGNARFTVTDIQDDTVTVDGNHNLAGQTLVFEVEVREVREAQEDELQLLKQNL